MWPHGEEWVHEAIAETYVPLLNSLYDLRDESVNFRLTVSVTPILAEQLADPLIIQHFLTYAEERSAWAAADITRFDEAREPEMKALAIHFHHWYSRVLTTFRDRFNGDILGALRILQDEGLIEVSTSAATHGYLPLLARDSSVFGQIQTGVASYERHFGRRPKAIWLPECAYRPAYFDRVNGVDVRRPGIESFLEAENLSVFFTETHTVEGGQPVGKAAGEAMGMYGVVARRYAIQPLPASAEQMEPGSTYETYWVGDAPGTVAVLGRNNRTGQQVWSGSFGYPGDPCYREFHRKDGVSGMQYWSVGGAGVDLGSKPPYDPARAQQRIKDHARHFAGLVEELLVAHHASTGNFGIIASNYDTELFGHWWFEGVDWLREVLRLLAGSELVSLNTASGFIEEHPPETVIALPESSWGSGGNHFTWLNVDTEWMWPSIHAAEYRMEQLVERFSDAMGQTRALLDQAARELLLLQSSDWPFLVTTGQAKEYASQRFSDHVDRFNALAAIAERGDGLTTQEAGMLDALRERDNPFPDIDYRVFAARQGSAGIAG